MKFYYLLLLLSIGFIVVSCESDDDAEDCITTDLTYTNYTRVVLKSNCATTDACHAAGGILPILETYDQTVLAFGISPVLKSINHESGVEPMPRGSQKLEQCDIDKIQAWVDAGAPE